jgi:hypothetical protein
MTAVRFAPTRRIGRSRRVAPVLLALALFHARPAHAQDALGFFKNYFLTGDYVAAGVALRGTGGSGVIDLTDANVPAGADVVGAFLYWQTVLKLQDGMQAGTAGAMFNGEPLTAVNGFSIARPVNPSGTAPCWSSGGGTGSSNGTHKAVSYRADVLRMLQDPDVPGKIDVRRQFEVVLPDPGSTGNLTPSTSGATLVVLWRLASRPMRAVVIYDGGFTLDNSNRRMTQTIEGFYQPHLAAPDAKMTHVVADGQMNFSESMLFNGQVVGGADPFGGPAWDTLTVGGLPLTGSATAATTATVSVEPVGGGSFDCLSWTALIFSTAVQDGDEDGLLDVWESSTTPLRDPNARCAAAGTALYCFLPNLKAMGADPNRQDVFVEINHMTTGGYATQAQPTPGVPAHSHLPSKQVLERVAVAFAGAPPRPRRFGTGTISGPIRIHFDVGANHQTGLPSVASCANNWQPACSIIPVGTGARGGEAINETDGCVLAADLWDCGGTFAGYPGTVGWKSGFLLLKNQPLNLDVQPGSPSLEQQCLNQGAACVRRFDRNRKDIFRYALFSHALGLESAVAGKPKNTSGIADGGGVGGGDLMVSLGFWDSYVGTEFIQASTLLHELGHTMSLRHGGGAPVEVEVVPGQVVPVAQPNCKSNYLSIMNYLFQVKGLLGAGSAPTPTIDFSRQDLGLLNEGNLVENLSAQPGWNAMAYRTSWFAPSTNVELQSVLGPVTRRCDGTLLGDGAPFMVRVDGPSRIGLIDWNWDGDTLDAALVQDINFNSATNDGSVVTLPDASKTANVTFAGYNDFDHLDLRQTASRRNAGTERIDGGLSLDVGFGDVGFGDVGFGDVGFGDVGFGDVGFGDVGFGDVGFGDVGFGDVGFGDVGFGDVGFGDVGAPPGELDLDTAAGLNAPNSLTATVLSNRIRLNWTAPHVGSVLSYTVYKVVGAAITPTTDITTVGSLVPTTAGNVTTVEDRDVKNNVTYTYFVVAELTAPLTQGGSTLTGPSNFVTVTK